MILEFDYISILLLLLLLFAERTADFEHPPIGSGSCGTIIIGRHGAEQRRQAESAEKVRRCRYLSPLR